ncbi:family 78 glycoside hydrolase catalytic domain [Hymenobacter sp. BT186]|uniref:alpha-L-rhamnosidase n=2 Tax=Hymenobacter telluris TaxID=2816474 RepID=A0A939ETF4_9BACT|nr:family 78 glycoside hydrolase catalytic domain [Hymenobacter telluris]MBW3372656.1 glycoside hydrolase family 78 protein [Hymenobacter norwichensis]
MAARSWLFGLLLLLPGALRAADLRIVNLQVEYTQTPLGMDVEAPRFSWQLAAAPSQPRGCRQTAYQVRVSNEAGELVWDSRKVARSASLNILYAGQPLAPTTRYTWVVEVWDQQNEKHTAASWFETGLLNPDPQLTAWSGAKWIGGGDEDMVLYSPYLPVFKLGYTVQLDAASKSTRASFLYGANDPRLLDKHKNLYHLQNQLDESYLRLELDIAPLAKQSKAQLHIYRAGYHPTDKKDTPFKSYAIPTALLNQATKYAKHTIELTSDLGLTRIYLDGNQQENQVAEVNLNPLGQGGDFIAFPVVADIGFAVPPGQSAAFSNVELRNFRSPSNVVFSEQLTAQPYTGIFSATSTVRVRNGAYQVRGGATGALVLGNPSRNATPMLRTTFAAAAAKIAKARLYVTARGIYDVYLNGRRLDSAYFNPGLTQYPKTHLYQTYDVTAQVRPGSNALGAILAEGWWSGGATYMGGFWNFFGDRQSLLAKLVVTYVNGNQDVIVSNPATWSYFNGGPTVYGSFFQGEVYDATQEARIAQWSLPTYPASGWKPVQEVGLMQHVSRDRAEWANMPAVDDYSQAKLVGQFGQTVRPIAELTAKSVEEVRPGVFVYDMGQNMVGVPRITLTGMRAGQRIVLRYAEVQYPNLPEYKGQEGMLMLENIRAAMAQDIYLAKGGTETIAPRFTYHGYRFVEITGIERALPVAAVKGTVLSSLDKLASHYESSNPLVNKLWENITWSMRGNFLSIPTDCPQRNERLGWSGDISVFSRTATYLGYVPQFLRRHMQAMRDVQRPDGRFSDVAPLGGGFGGTLWGSAGITVAWESYQQYGDQQLLAEHYDAMKSYITYLRHKLDPKTGVLNDGPLGDWLGPEQNRNDNTLLWEAYFLFDLDIMQKVATALGKTADAQEFATLHQQRKQFFNATYVEKQTKRTIHSGFKQHHNTNPTSGDLVDTQASYVLPLALGGYAPENHAQAVANLLTTITRQNKLDTGGMAPPYSLLTGFIGTAWISRALSENGHADVAYRLLQQTTYPSWLYSVEQGATTIWERLNSYTHTEGFGGNNRMNSFNHYSFGAVGAWLYDTSLGIARDENSPGFQHFILQPTPDPTGAMTFANGYYDSMYGRIESSWQKTGATYQYRLVVPANTTATLYLPAQKERDVTEGGRRAAKAAGVQFLRLEHGKAVYEVRSGNYLFTTTQ